MKNVVLCDFDGTITSMDSCEIVLNRFAKGEWERYDEQLLRGGISLEECMRKQFQMIKASRAMILHVLENYIFFRPNLKELVNYCRVKHIPFIIVSGGLDFVVRHFLKKNELDNYVEVVAAKTKFIEDNIELEYPKKLFDNSVDFKEDLVKKYKNEGFRVIFIGDGLSDFQAVGKADFIFVVADSRLAAKCREERIQHEEFADFSQVAQRISSW